MRAMDYNMSLEYNLSVGRIVLDAALPMQLLMLVLGVATIAALGLAVSKLTRPIDGGSAFLRALRWAGPLMGLSGGAYTTLYTFVAVTKRQEMSLLALAPGLAEATLCMVLGLMAGVVAAVATGAINARIDRAVLAN